MGVHTLAALALLLAGHQQAPVLRAPAPCAGSPGFTCSVVDVPLDRSGRHAGMLHLRVAAADNVRAPRGVLLVIAGGPGQPATQLVARFAGQALAAERKAYRIVAYDQRGTGAGALSCGALQAAMGSSDLAPPPAAAVRACARKLGARRQFFGTDDVVADMDALRRALGAERWTLDGISYGTFVGERYALAHPQRVQRLVLDSVVPHVGETDLGVDEFRATRRVLRTVCGDACVRDLATTVRRYRSGPRLLDALTVLSIADPTYRTLIDVPAALHAAARGDRSSLDLWLRTARAWQAAPATALDQGLHASALCADWRYPWGSSAAPLASRAAKLRRAVARLRPAALYPFDRATAAGNGFIRQCLPWAPTPPTPLVPGKIRVPTLLVNGDHDLSTPLEWAREELRLTTNAKLVVVRGAGHSTQSRASTDVSRKAVARFLLG
ncbi:MAG TPA: alpha/beta fold hydrolase [Gaiellaceae bacterium]|nr:alpha/beta fold hydrolase [Gaiellaceae bacterium]